MLITLDFFLFFRAVETGTDIVFRQRLPKYANFLVKILIHVPQGDL